MKKGRIRFYQLSIAYTILWLALCLSYVSIAVYFIVMLATDGDDGYMYRDRLFLPDWLMITLAVIVLVMFFRALVESYAYHIDFEDGKIKTEGDRVVSRTFRLQFKLSIKIKDITDVIERFAPLAYQESYDNAGLIVGRPDDEVRQASKIFLVCMHTASRIQLLSSAAPVVLSAMGSPPYII